MRWTLPRRACRWALLVAILSWAPPALAAKIACVGDSITAGYGLSNAAQQSYPAVLQSLLGSKHTVQNFGTSGCTLLKKGDQPYWNDGNFGASDTFKPDVVIIMLGTNDAKPQNWSHKAEFATDYASLIDHYRSRGAQVYAATPPPVFSTGAFDISPSVLNQEIVPLVRQIAVDQGTSLIDVFQALTGKGSNFPDNIHPNAEGAKLIAQTVATALQAGLSGTGGTSGTGGAGTGGVTGSGGSPRGSGGSGTGDGGVGTGGVARGSGGAGTGGRTSGSGGSVLGSGGSPGSGGVAAAGGAPGSGGSSENSGGATATGGAGGSGGAVGSGGTAGSGGTGGSGGTAGSGGAAGGSGGSSAVRTSTSTSRSGDAGGCSCRTSVGQQGWGGLCFVGLAWLLRRRRRGC